MFLALAVANSFIIPSFESMDEPEHFNFMRFVADGRGLPDQRDVAIARAYNYYQEGGQPPLYYVTGALVLRLLGENVNDVDGLTVPNPFSTCGDLSQPYSKGLWMRDPLREAWPMQGAALGVHMVRLLGAVFGVATVGGTYMTAKTAFPAVRNVGILAAALVAFNPRFLVLSATVTNDTLLAALCAWGLCLSVDTLRRGPSWPKSIALGVVTGLAGLTKVSGLFLLPLAGLALVASAWRSRDWSQFFGHLALVGALGVAIGGWWYLSNLVRYGDPGLVPLLTQDTGRRSAWPARLIVPEIRKFFNSYWASANYCELRFGYFPLYGALSVLGMAGLVLGLRRGDRAARWSTFLLLVWVLGVFISWVAFNSMVFAPNGRYLFQANGAIGPLLAVGILVLAGRWAAVWRPITVGLAAIAIVTPAGILGPLYAAPSLRPIDDVSVEQPLEAVFGGRVRLLGYDLSSEEVRAGQAIDVTLHLSAARSITASLALGLQMKSAGPRDDTVLVNFRNWPGGGNLPTTAWVPGKAFADHYRLRIPADVVDVQDWELRLMFFEYPRREGRDDRLPVVVEGAAGGPYVVLGRVRVEPLEQGTVPVISQLRSPLAFGIGQEAVLEGADVALREDGESLEVTLWWRARETLGAEYTVFVHLLNGEGQLIASGDDLPRGGAMPTDRWQRGDLVVDPHVIILPGELLPGTYQLNVGLYNDSGRLAAWDGQGNRISGDTVHIAEWKNGGT